MALQAKKLRDIRASVWGGVGMTVCFIAASAVLVSALASGQQLVPPSTATHVAPLAPASSGR